MVDPGDFSRAAEQIGPPRRRRFFGGGNGDSSCSDCGPDCDGCDLPCDLFHLSLLGTLALRTPTRPPRRRATGPALAGIAAIRAYQRLLSPRLPTVCRHVPSCSAYGVVAVRRYGLATGVRLTAGRISRCTSAVPRGTVDQVP